MASEELVKVRQQDRKDLVDWYKRFINVVERYKSYGRVNPVVIAEKSPRCSSDPSAAVESEERNKLLAFLLMDRVDQKLYGSLMCSLHSDFALGNGMYPETLEDGMHVLTTKGDDNEISLSFVCSRVSGSAGNAVKWGTSRRIVLSLRRRRRRIRSFFPGLVKCIYVRSSGM